MSKNPVIKKNDTDADQSVGDILSATGQELERLGELADELQMRLSDIVDAANGDRSESIFELQNIDFLRQSLAGISDYLTNLADQTPENWRLDTLRAAQVVTLADLAERLRKADASDISNNDNSGDCDFF